MSEEIDPVVVEQLKASKQARGYHEKVVLSADGKLVDGHQRKAADPDWPEEVNSSLKTVEDVVLYQIDKNWFRTSKKEDWKRARLIELAGRGHDVHWIAKETGLSERTVYYYLPDEFKDSVKSLAGRAGGIQTGKELSAASPAPKSQDIIHVAEDERPLAEEMLEYAEKEHAKREQSAFECHNCHLKTWERDGKEVDGYMYCLKCAPFVHVRGKKAEQLAVKETWEYRKAAMHPEKSAFELAVIQDLQKEGYCIETDREFCLESTVPDGLMPGEKVAVYVDGPPHRGREDRDEATREKLKHRYPDDVRDIIVLNFDSDTKQNREKAKTEFRDFLKEVERWKK